MAELKKDYYLLIETLMGIFTIEKGIIKILLVRKRTEPYKGYWILPGSMLKNNESLEECVTSLVTTKLGMPNMYIEQSHAYGNVDRDIDNRVVGISYFGLINNITLKLKQQNLDNIEMEWFSIDSLPKTAFDHDIIIDNLIKDFKNKILNVDILKILFPSDFTIPELQIVYEQVLNTKLDRRNFRKKLINLGYIEDTCEVNEGFSGRPAKLYRFRDNIENKNLF